MITIKEEVTCPYCGCVQRVAFDVQHQYDDGPLVRACDIEEGGCDKYFAVFLRLTTTADVREISGENVQEATV